MSWSSRRAILVLAVVAALGGASIVQHAFAQRVVRPIRKRPPVGIALPPGGIVPGGPGVPGGPDAPAAKPSYDLGQLTLPKDDDLAQKVEAADDAIKLRDWKKATRILQDLLGREQDVFVPRERKLPDGQVSTHYVSVKKEALRMIGALPGPGLQFYKDTYGPKADSEVKAARTNNDARRMGVALSLYLYTDAGAEAANWLATYNLDRADFRGAATFYKKLIQRSGIGALKEGQLVKAAFAFHQAGMPEDLRDKEACLKELQKREADIKLRGEPRTVADLKEAIDRFVIAISSESASDSPIYRGRPSRNAMLPGGTPFLEPLWRQKMVQSDDTGRHVKQAIDALESRRLPLFTAFTPVTATLTKGTRKVPLLVYRSYWGVHAVNMKTGKFEWESPSDWSLDRVLGATGRDRDSQKVNAYTQWLNHWLQQNARPQTLFDNSVLGTLSSDSKMVYAVEDVAIPAPQHMMFPANPWGGMTWNFGTEVNKALNHNKLQAFELAKGGKLAWEIGGDEKGPLADTFFLGPPLPLNGRLYVLTEKQQELRLAQIDPASGKVLSLQPLANTKNLKLAHDPLRRIQACHLSHGEGILVVPTNAGAVFGIDLLSGSLAWAYPYGEKVGGPAPPPANPWGPPPPGWIRLPNGRLVPAATNNTHWQVTAPAIQDGKVVFTSPDARDIHCVNLRDGSRAWARPRNDGDLYLAGVFNGKVVIVGSAKTRALSLTRGDKVWEVETGLPSGQGAASALPGSGDVIYYLPIREALQSKEPEICAINVDRGIIHAHTRSRRKEIPGNLLFYEGSVLSQAHDSVVAYPQLEVQLARMDAKVKDNPNDPDALTERGDYLLDKGDLARAIADFRRALRQSEIKADTRHKARSKLYDAFTEYFQRDFNKAEDFLKEYEEMCNIDLKDKTGAELTALKAEQRRRRANFLCLVGKGREAQSRLVDAFEKYLELGENAQKDELIQVVDEPSVKAAPDVWSQGRIAAMVARATDAKQKAALEAKIKERWARLKGSNVPALSDLRKFVALFGSLFGVGKDARFALAERLMDDPDLNSLLEAEQHLTLLRGDPSPAVAARALEALARLNTRKGLLEDAAFYYRLLGEKYPKVVVDGKKGEEYLEDLSTDKRFLPYIDQASRYVIKGKVELRYKTDNTGTSTAQAYQFHHDGEALPFFLRNRLAMKLDYSQKLILADAGTGEDRWNGGLTLTRTQFQSIAQNNHRVRFGFQSAGHLVVLQLGHMVFGIDPLNKGRVLWERNLSMLPNSATNPPYWQSLVHDPRDNSLVLAYSDGHVQRLGTVGPLQGGVVCLQKRDSLSAIDPVTGRTLWTRNDVNSRAHVFGDEQHIYVVGVGENGAVTGSRVFRAYDGVNVRVPEFSHVYDQRMRVMGRHILASSIDARGVLTMRVYDVLDGKDVWKKEFPKGSVVMQSEDPRLAGIIEPTGEVRVLDVQTQKEVVTTKLVDPRHVANPLSVHLLADPDYVFVAINGQTDTNKVNGPVHPNFTAGAGLRSVPVNGFLYAFERKGGKLRWYNLVENEHLVVSQFEDLPLLFFSARYSKWQGNLPFRSIVQACTARAIAKHNGKLWYVNESVPQGTYFHDLKMDHRTGQVEVAGYPLKVTMNAVAK